VPRPPYRPAELHFGSAANRQKKQHDALSDIHYDPHTCRYMYHHPLYIITEKTQYDTVDDLHVGVFPFFS
jgi:hypothetical protein